MNLWKVILAVALIFGCGAITGALIYRETLPPPPAAVQTERAIPNHDTTNPPVALVEKSATNRDETITNLPPWHQERVEFLHRIEKRLNLTHEQRGRIELIMKESLERTQPVWDQIAPQMRAELERVRASIRAELTPDQQKKFDAMLKSKSPKKPEPDDKHRHPAKPEKMETNGPVQPPAHEKLVEKTAQ